jgi:hypothetical protein
MRFLAKRVHPYLTQDGIEGLTNLCDSPDQNIFMKLLLAIDKRFYGYAQFARDWVTFENRLNHESICHVCHDFFGYLGLEIQSNRIPEALKQPGKSMILLGINHEAIIEPLILASLLGRNDIKFVGMKVFQYLGPNVAKYILPVLPKKVAHDNGNDRKSSFSIKFDIILDLYRLESLSLAEIEQLNSSSIQQAADHLAEGGVLIIFPNGGRDVSCSWYQGIGQILSLLPPDRVANTPIFPIGTNGLSRKSLSQKAKQAAFSRSSASVVNAHIYDPIYLPSWCSDSTPTELVEYLRKQTNGQLRDQRALHKQPLIREPVPVT